VFTPGGDRRGEQGDKFHPWGAKFTPEARGEVLKTEIFSSALKNVLAYYICRYNAGVVVVTSKVVRLAPEFAVVLKGQQRETI
jgi:hypothetical protein